MKVQELRQLMETADMEHLMKAFVESYKQLKKGQKEEIDPVLVSILKGNEIEKKKAEAVVDFDELAKQVAEWENKLDSLKKRYDERYYLESAINELCTVLLGLSVGLADMDQGMKYFFGHYKDKQKEAALYHALRLLVQMEEDDLWIAVYEYAVQKKIEPYDAMKRSYADRKKRRNFYG